MTKFFFAIVFEGEDFEEALTKLREYIPAPNSLKVKDGFTTMCGELDYLKEITTNNAKFNKLREALKGILE